jgi:hypothetical protein
MADDGLSRLIDDEKTALVALLKRTIDADRYPFSPRIRTLRGILEKLGPGPHRVSRRTDAAPKRSYQYQNFLQTCSCNI